MVTRNQGSFRLIANGAVDLVLDKDTPVPSKQGWLQGFVTEWNRIN